MKKVVLLGFYGGINFGDEVILENLSVLYKKEFLQKSITICCLNPDYVKKRFFVPTFEIGRGWRGLKVFFNEMQKHDLLIVGGGGLLQDYGHNPDPIFIIMMRVFIAALLRKVVLFYSVGLGPIETIRGRLLTALFCKFVNIITVRDEESKNLLLRLGIQEKKIHVLPDPAFAIRKVLDKSFTRQHEKQSCFGISVLPFFKLAHGKPDDDIRARKIITDVCNYLIEQKKYSVIFFPCHEEPDSAESESIINGIRNRDKVLLSSWRSNGGVNYDFFKQIDFLISMRLHPQILASVFGIPFISIVYHPKAASLAKMLDYDEFSCDLTTVTTELILALVEKMEKNREQISRDLICKANRIFGKMESSEQLIRSYL